MKKIQYIYFLNIAATIAVLYLHCNGCFWTYSDSFVWKSSVYIETLFYWAVPVFFMIPGVTLIDYRDRCSTREYFSRKIKKTLVPYIFWINVPFIYKGVLSGQLSSFSLSKVIDNLVNSRGESIYWFFVPLFILYCSIPFLGMIDFEKRKRCYTYLFLFAFITESFIPFVLTLLNIEISDYITSPVSGGFLLYPLLGYLIEYCYKLNFKQRLIVYVLGAISWFFLFFFVIHWSIRDGAINNVWGGYLNVPTIIYSVAIFVFFKYEALKLFKKRQNNIFIPQVASLGLGVYLIHIYFVNRIPRILNISNETLVWRIVGPLFLYCLCIVVVSCMKKVPIIKYLVP